MIDSNKKIILDRVYYYMSQEDLNISQFAKRLGTTQQNLSNLFNKRKSFSMKWIERFAIALDKTVFDLLTPLPEGTEIKSPDGRKNKQKKI